jgi:nucleoid-associated protein YgaU
MQGFWDIGVWDVAEWPSGVTINSAAPPALPEIPEGEYLEHITAAGERWDTLANRYYGDPMKYELIIAANPDVLIAPILPSGLKLKIPVLEEPETIQENLPPWKQ